MRLKDIEDSLKSMDTDSALQYLQSLKESRSASICRLIEKYSKKKAAAEKEKARYRQMCNYEFEAYASGYSFVAGIDEAGRGPLAGPVVAAAVILPADAFIAGLNDSKQLSGKQRDYLSDVIKEKAVSCGIGTVDEKCIDEINILNATKRAMEDAIRQLDPQPDMILIDAVALDNIKTRQLSIIKGDALSVSIAAASIIAKVTRDRIIEKLDPLYPQYGFAKHKGYGTGEHIEAIKKYGICPIHRVSFTKNFTAT